VCTPPDMVDKLRCLSMQMIDCRLGRRADSSTKADADATAEWPTATVTRANYSGSRVLRLRQTVNAAALTSSNEPGSGTGAASARIAATPPPKGERTAVPEVV
jgi:hypothetical protein